MFNNRWRQPLGRGYSVLMMNTDMTAKGRVRTTSETRAKTDTHMRANTSPISDTKAADTHRTRNTSPATNTKATDTRMTTHRSTIENTTPNTSGEVNTQM